MGPSKSLLKESDLAEWQLFCRPFCLVSFFHTTHNQNQWGLPSEKKSIWPRVLGTFDFLSRHYIGIRTRKNFRRPAVFPIECWNVHDCIGLNKPRTNNEVEGWHRGFQVCAQTCHIILFGKTSFAFRAGFFTGFPKFNSIKAQEIV